MRLMNCPPAGLALWLTGTVWLTGLFSPALLQAEDWSFELQFTREVHPEPYTGRVYLIFSVRQTEPRFGPGWFDPEQFASLEVQNWKPGETLAINSRTPGLKGFPGPFQDLNLARYRAQAVVRFNPWEREVGTGPGNGFSPVKSLPATPGPEPIRLLVHQLVPERQFPQSQWARELKVRSELLSQFYQREVFLRAGVLLPRSYHAEPNRRYPVIFNIPGFGGEHYGMPKSPPTETNQDGVEFIRVTLDPSCPLGHHVFANSANNGPCGDALVKELIPALDQGFRTIPQPTARFLTGHSSGGWSSLWVMVNYPDSFAATWSTAPDPVDFRDFQRINLYRPQENMFTTPEGERRPLARSGDQVVLWYNNFSRMEDVLGYGGQLHSFEAVFSPRGEDGQPRLLWNRETGAIDPQVAEAWKKYDIRLLLEENWPTLGTKLQGKLHVIMGDQDTFYLEGAAVLLKQSLAKLSDDPRVELVRGRDHMNLMDGRLMQRIRTEMVQTFLKHHPDAGRPAPNNP